MFKINSLRCCQNCPFQETTSEQSNWTRLFMSNFVWQGHISLVIPAYQPNEWSIFWLLFRESDFCAQNLHFFTESFVCINFVEIWQWLEFNALPMWNTCLPSNLLYSPVIRNHTYGSKFTGPLLAHLVVGCETDETLIVIVVQLTSR